MAIADIDTILTRHPGAERDSLIPILQEVQNAEGYVSRDAVERIGAHLKLPASKIYGVATFYNQFRFEKLGRFHIQICRGTACHVKGSAAVCDALCRQLAIQPGQTSRDGLFSLEVVACLGACGLAPVISINGEFHGRLSPESIAQLLADCRTRAGETRRGERDDALEVQRATHDGKEAVR